MCPQIIIFLILRFSQEKIFLKMKLQESFLIFFVNFSKIKVSLDRLLLFVSVVLFENAQNYFHKLTLLKFEGALC